MLIALLIVVCVCAVGPALLFAANLRLYLPPPVAFALQSSHVAVLIPARNEEANIAEALECVLASTDVAIEVCVLDDASTDATAAIVRAIAVHDARVRLLQSAALPAGWNGKQHACWQLAQASTAPLLLFLDADVRVAPQCVAGMAAFQKASGAALVSGFPRLITITWLEKLLLPLIHFVLLAFLPMARMRATANASLAAGCGQFLLCEREAYFASGGHAAIRATMHDGLLLPRAFRRAGFRTDLADITALASVRMYANAAQVWNGLAKNATEGLAAPKRIVPLTLLLLVGQVVPIMLLAVLIAMVVSIHLVGAEYDHPLRFALFFVATCIAAVASFVPRLLAVGRFRQSLSSALLHPLGIMALLCVQWYALARQLLGRPVGWRQRAYASATSGEVGSKVHSEVQSD
jgi:hypothetical protein